MIGKILIIGLVLGMIGLCLSVLFLVWAVKNRSEELDIEHEELKKKNAKNG